MWIIWLLNFAFCLAVVTFSILNCCGGKKQPKKEAAKKGPNKGKPAAAKKGGKNAKLGTLL